MSGPRLPLRHFRRLFDALRRRYGFDDCEVTVEMDPGTFTEETVEELVPWHLTRTGQNLYI